MKAWFLSLGTLSLFALVGAEGQTIFTQDFSSASFVAGQAPGSGWNVPGTESYNGATPGNPGNASVTVVAANPNGGSGQALWYYDNTINASPETAAYLVLQPQVNFQNNPAGVNAYQTSFDFQLQSLSLFYFVGAGHTTIKESGGFVIAPGTGAQTGEDLISTSGWGTTTTTAALDIGTWYHAAVITPPSGSTGGAVSLLITDMNGNTVFTMSGTQDGPTSYDSLFFRPGTSNLSSANASVYLTDFQVSIVPAPEPSEIALAALGFLILLARLRQAPSQAWSTAPSTSSSAATSLSPAGLRAKRSRSASA